MPYLCSRLANTSRDMSKKTRLKIGEFSELMQVTVKTLRHYEQKGLLVPDEVDEWTGYRYYSIDQMQQLKDIRDLQRLGFSLDEIKDLFDDGSHTPTIRQMTEKIRETESQLKALIARRNQLLDWRNARKEMKTMEKFSIQSLPEIIVASHREVIPNYAAIGPMCVEATVLLSSTTRSTRRRTSTSSIANRWRRWATTAPSSSSSACPPCLVHSA